VLGGGAETTGTAEVVLFEGGGIGGEGSFTGDVALFAAGGGRGAEGSWIGAVAVLATTGTAEVAALEGEILPVTGLTGAVASRAWVTPAPGRARSVIRTVSFFSGTAEVFGVEEGLSESLMCGDVNKGEFLFSLANSALGRQSLFLHGCKYPSGARYFPLFVAFCPLPFSFFMKRILVTGGAGFIGSHTVQRLLSEGVESVAVLDSFNDYYNPAIKRANIGAMADPRLSVQEGELNDAAFVGEVFEKGRFDAVVHLAARAGVRPSIEQPELYIDTNIKGTFNLLEAARRTGVKQFVFASSSSVYGVNKKVPFSEADPILQTISPYAMTKMAGEQMCSNYSHLYGIKTVCLRFFTVYGPRQRPDLAISKFTRLIEDGKPIDKFGSGTTARDYTFVTDIVDGILGSVNYTTGPICDIFNLGGSQTVTLNDLIAAIEEATGKKAQINQLPDQPGDVPLTSADVSKATALLNFKPTTHIHQGIPKFVEWFREMRAKGVAVC